MQEHNRTRRNVNQNSLAGLYSGAHNGNMLKKQGAPKGGRVHWFLWWLDVELRKRYRIIYEYATHNYLLFKYKKRTIVSVIMIMRTSKRVFRVSYFNLVTQKSFYRSFQSAKLCAEWLNKFAKSEEQDEERTIALNQTLETFAKRLRFALSAQQRTQTALANYVGVRQQTVSKWLHRQFLPSAPILNKIAEYFNIPLGWFLGDKQ